MNEWLNIQCVPTPTLFVPAQGGAATVGIATEAGQEIETENAKVIIKE